MFTAWLNIKRRCRESRYDAYHAVAGRSWPDLRRKVEAEFAKGQHWKIFRVDRYAVGGNVLNIRTFRKFPLNMPEDLRVTSAQTPDVNRNASRRKGGGKGRCSQSG